IHHIKKRRGRSPAAVVDRVVRRNQRSSCRTLWFDWLASASAETAIDWRVDSAWLLAASSLESASVRLDEPVCSTLIRFLLKSWRICTIDRLAPKAEACERSVMLAVLSADSTVLVAALSTKAVPETRLARPRPAGLNVTPGIVTVDLPVSLNTSFSESPLSRLMPLKDASCAVVVICVMIWLYWVTRLARAACDTVSFTAAVTEPKVPLAAPAEMSIALSAVGVVAVAPTVTVWPEASLDEVKVSLVGAVGSNEAITLTPASASAWLS